MIWSFIILKGSREASPMSRRMTGLKSEASWRELQCWCEMCTCCGDHRTSPYSLMSLRIASPFKASVSVFKGISDRRHFIWRVTLCLFTTCRHPIKTPTIVRQIDLMNIIKRVIIQTGSGFVFLEVTRTSRYRTQTSTSPPAWHHITWLCGRAEDRLAVFSSTGRRHLHWPQATGELWARQARGRSVRTSVCTASPWWAGRSERNSSKNAVYWNPARAVFKLLLTFVSFDILDNIRKAWGKR